MIKKLETKEIQIGCCKDGSLIVERKTATAEEIQDKINELVDAVNELQKRIDPPSVYEVMKEKDEIIARHIGEKNKLQKALDVALDELEGCEEWFMGSKLEKQFMLERIYKAYDKINEIKGGKDENI